MWRLSQYCAVYHKLRWSRLCLLSQTLAPNFTIGCATCYNFHKRLCILSQSIVHSWNLSQTVSRFFQSFSLNQSYQSFSLYRASVSPQTKTALEFWKPHPPLQKQHSPVDKPPVCASTCSLRPPAPLLFIHPLTLTIHVNIVLLPLSNSSALFLQIHHQPLPLTLTLHSPTVLTHTPHASAHSVLQFSSNLSNYNKT